MTIFVLAVQTGKLSASRAFTTLSIIEIITTPLGLLLQALPSITSSLACLDRIQTYLKSTERTFPRVAVPETPPKSTSTEKSSITSALFGMENTAIAFHGASISHSAAGSDSGVLHSISWTVSQGSIAMVTGPVGSGKTSLLKAILGEMDVQGEIFVRPGPIGYCDQSPWIPNGSVQECIIGMSDAEFNQSWYDEVLYTCALEEDQDLFSLCQGTETKTVGSGGLALSEGQKQRLVKYAHVFSLSTLVVSRLWLTFGKQTSGTRKGDILARTVANLRRYLPIA